MSDTMKSFAATLAQVAVRMGPVFGAKGVMVAAIASLALAQPAAAQVSVDLVPGHQPLASEQQAIDKSKDTGISEATARNIGRVSGGLLGFGVGRAFGLNGLGEALMAVGGVFAGAKAGEAIHGSTRTQAFTPGAAADIAAGEGERANGKGRALPPDIQDRMTGLVVDAAAARVIAQERYASFARAEMDLATRPGHAQERAALGTARVAFEGSMNAFRAALAAMSNAVHVAHQQGYAVQGYIDARSELSRRVGQDGELPLDHPAIVARVAQLRSHPQAASMKLLDESALQGAQVVQRERSAYSQ